MGSMYMCVCPSEFIGSHCEIAALTSDACSGNPCQNDGVCFRRAALSATGKAYFCSCNRLFGGENCEVSISPCDNQPCQNGGFCANADNERGYVCECVESYKGP